MKKMVIDLELEAIELPHSLHSKVTEIYTFLIFCLYDFLKFFLKSHSEAEAALELATITQVCLQLKLPLPLSLN